MKLWDRWDILMSKRSFYTAYNLFCFFNCRSTSIFGSSGMTWVSIDLWTCSSCLRWQAWKSLYLWSLKSSPWTVINNWEQILRISFPITWKNGQRQRLLRAKFEKVGPSNQLFLMVGLFIIIIIIIISLFVVVLAVVRGFYFLFFECLHKVAFCAVFGIKRWA